jgi:hypothetical protein
MKIAAVILIAVGLAYALWDLITQTLDIYTFLMLAVVIALSSWIVAIENQEQQS